MNAETKRHIDSARQVLVGVVPNPTSQIDQITNALIYKFMDDMDQAAIKHGGNPTFFVEDLEKYAWTRLMDSRIGNQERMNLYVEALQKFSESKRLPELFRSIFRSAFLPYRSPEVLGLFLKEINYFDYSHPEELGNAYEYLLSIMSSQGDAGQFRTPRHIIDFIVEVIDPKKGDKILDPACGTAGFLISAYRHILKDHDVLDDTEEKEKPLTPDEKRNLFNNFEGYDIDPGMVRIAQVNMYLHQFKNPKIFQYDSLSNDERWNDKFDVILANPPFMSPQGGVQTHNRFSVSSTRSEVLFVDYIMNHLRPKGRAGIIVPEGIIFQSGTAHRQLRKNLVEGGLYAVVSLPSGVFAPYSGVKTSLLLFNNEWAKQKNEILFVKVENDGHDLGAQRRPISKNDLPMALEILNRWRTGEKLENKLAVYVEKERIAESAGYNLSCDRYRVAADYTNAKWPMVELGEVSFVLKGSAITKKDTVKGDVPVIAGGQQPAYFHNKSNRDGDVITVSASGAYAGFVNYFSSPIFASDCSTVQAKDKNIISTRFLYRVLKAKQEEIYSMQQGGGQPHVYPKDLKQIKIPIPPLDIQEPVVKELDRYAAIIVGAKLITTNWKPKVDIDADWDKVKLGDVCEVYGGGTPSRLEEKYWGGSIPWLSARYFSDDHRIKGSEMITEQGLKNSSSKIAPKGSTILITRVSVGKFAIADQDYAINQDLTALVARSKNLNSQYLWLISEIVAERIKDSAVGVGVTGVTRDFVVNEEIPLPPLEIQKKIVEKIEAERVLVESAKKLIKIYEDKTKSDLERLYGHDD